VEILPINTERRRTSFVPFRGARELPPLPRYLILITVLDGLGLYLF
jgi:hypothetical protein